MARLSISTYLDAAPETVKAHVMTPRLLNYVARGVLTFKPLEPPTFPEIWTPGEYKVKMLWKGFLPVGHQIVGIELPPAEGETEFIRDNGRGALIKVWDHMIELTPEGEGTRYTDRLEVKAGLLTPFVWMFASLFYRHRQKRWRKLVRHGFDYYL